MFMFFKTHNAAEAVKLCEAGARFCDKIRTLNIAQVFASFLFKLFYVQWLYFLALRVLVLVVGSFVNVYLAILGFFIRIYFACTLLLFLYLTSVYQKNIYSIFTSLHET